MKYLVISFMILSTSAARGGELHINVVYPDSGRQIPDVDSIFIFGNVTPGASLKINGFDIEIHKQGGWLAFLPVESGTFVFSMRAVSGADTAYLDYPVPIGSADSAAMFLRPLIPHSITPDTSVVYSPGDVFEFSFKAPPGGDGWFKVGESDSIPMLPTPETDRVYWGDVFGQSAYSGSDSTEYINYRGSYRLTPADTGRHCVYYNYTNTGGGLYYPPPYRDPSLCTDSILTVIPEFPARVGELSGRSNIIRTGPGLGYKLLYLRPGIRARVTGAGYGYYRLALGSGISGYINMDSVMILPSGTPEPRGIVSFVLVDAIKDGVEISFDTGAKVLYEIRESVSPPGFDIDLFGTTGDIDWIRYNIEDPLAGLVTWSQPQDDILRISIDSGEGMIGGYDSYYDGTRFVFRIKRKPRAEGGLFKPMKGLKIVIDPGHSHDSGAKGPTGLREEDANLWIAHELRLLLIERGAEVLMTRYGHEHIRLYDRPKIAEKWGADLLISIHNNALPDGINPFIHNGTSVYYYHPHSKPLAEAIHKRMLKRTRLPDHGLYYGNLVLTRPSSMPAVLVECAFMMIPEQEAALKTDRFQRKCARAILEGIEDYLGSD